MPVAIAQEVFSFTLAHRMLTRISVLLTLALSPLCIKAQTGGGTSFQVLQAISPARVAALGGNAMAVKDGDLNLAFITPSLLDSATAGQMALGYTRYFGEANVSHAAYAHHIKGLGTMSIGIQAIGYGTFDMTDEAGNLTGNFTAGEYMVQVGLGRKLDEHFSIGSNAKFVHSQMAGFNAIALVADAAATYQNIKGDFAASLMFRNVGQVLNSYRPGIEEQLPFEIQAGVSKKLENAPLRFSLIGENLHVWDLTPGSSDELVRDPLTGEERQVNPGGFAENLMRHIVFNTEILLTENVHLRVGYNYNRRQQLKIEERPGTAGITWGLAFRVSKFHLSYGRAAYSLAGVTNHLGLSLRFDDFKKAAGPM
jgi:hypothetical protein